MNETKIISGKDEALKQLKIDRDYLVRNISASKVLVSSLSEQLNRWEKNLRLVDEDIKRLEQ
jgi:hypothetical protein